MDIVENMRTVADIEQRVKFDLWYIDNWSLAIDFKIILMTVFEIIRGRECVLVRRMHIRLMLLLRIFFGLRDFAFASSPGTWTV